MDENQVQNNGAGDNLVKHLQKADETKQDQSSMGKVIAGVDLEKRKFQLGTLFGNYCADYAEGSALDNWLKDRVQLGDNYVCSHPDPINFVSEFFTTNAVNTRIPGPIYEPPEMREKNLNLNGNDASQVEESYQQPILRFHINSSNTRMPMTPVLQQTNCAYQRVVPVKVETNADETPNDLLNNADIIDNQLDFTQSEVIDLSSSQESIDVANITQQTFSEPLDADKEQLAIENSIDVNVLSTIEQPITFEHLNESNVSMNESDTDQSHEKEVDVEDLEKVAVYEPHFEQSNGDLQIAKVDEPIEHPPEELQPFSEEFVNQPIEQPVEDSQTFEEKIGVEHPPVYSQIFDEEIDIENPVESSQASDQFIYQAIRQPSYDSQAVDEKIGIEHPDENLQSPENEVEQQAELISEIDAKPPIEVLQTPKIHVKHLEIKKQFLSAISKLEEELGGPRICNEADFNVEQASSRNSKKHVAAKELIEKSPERKFVISDFSSDSKNLGPLLTAVCQSVFEQAQYAFQKPVDTKKIKGYLDVIKEPMDLGTIKQMIKSKQITTLEDFYAKCMLVVNNATTFTPNPEERIHCDALKLKKICEDEIRKLFNSRRKSASYSSVSYQDESPARKRSRRSTSSRRY